MLNEWSDRQPPRPQGPLLLRMEFWLGALVVLATIAQILQLALWLLSWF
ncbi:MAG TPA: hypothetical protein VGB70_08420 [Allosphingosinicella sp.]|jgi:hypothetical protein